MTMTNAQDQSIARHMHALATMFEGEALNRNPIQYQAVIGWNPDQVGERCRFIDAAGCDGVVAIFHPDAVEAGPVMVGVCIPDGALVRLELGRLWTAKNGRTVLVTAKGRSHLEVEQGRFVERPGQPVRDLARGKHRARRRLAELAAKDETLVGIVIAA